MSKLSQQAWWVKAQLSLGRKVLVLMREGAVDPEDLVGRCSPPGVPYLSSRNVEGTLWDVLYDNGAVLTVQTTSHRTGQLSNSYPVRRSNGKKS